MLFLVLWQSAGKHIVVYKTFLEILSFKCLSKYRFSLLNLDAKEACEELSMEQYTKNKN